MANYYQNNDGTTSVKKKGTGKNFIQQENGSTTEVTFDNNVKKVKNKNATAPLAIIPKTILSTANYLGQGTLKGLEGIADAIIDVGTSNINPYYWFNQDKLKEHNKIAKEIIETDATNELITKLSGDENFNQNVLDKNSLIKSTNIGGQVAQGIGQMLPAISLGNPVAATGTIGISSYGSGVEEAYNDGANNLQAKLYGVGNMATELATEWITGGIPGVKNKLFSGLDNLVAKGLGKETLEEVSKSITKELLQVGYKMVGEGAEEGLTEILKPMLKNAIYTEGEKVNWDEVINSFVVGAITGGILEAPSNISHLKYAYNNSAKNSIQNNNTALAPLSINNNAINNDLNVQTNNNFQYKISDNSKINNLNQSMSQYFDNSQKTIDLSNTISKVIEDKNYNVIFDNSIRNSNSQLVDAQIKTLENGEVEIRINPNSQRAGEFLLMHEVTHTIETDSMKQLIIDYASKNSEFNQALESLKQTYGTEDISSEVIADISGQLFGKQEFINNLSIEKPTVFRRIYNKIIELANKITGNSKESLFIKDLKNKWEEAYRNTTTKQAISNLNNNTKFLKGKLISGEDVIVSDDINGTHPSKQIAEQNLKSMLGIKYLNSNNNTEISIENKDIKKYLNDGYNNQKNMKLKKRISGNYGEILEIAQIDPSKSQSNYKGTNRGKQGFDYYDVNLAYPVKDNNGNIINYKYYESRLVVRKDNNNNFAYDLDGFKEKKGAALDKTSLSIMTGKPVSSSFSANNVPQTNTNVNTSTKYSMQEM